MSTKKRHVLQHMPLEKNIKITWLLYHRRKDFQMNRFEKIIIIVSNLIVLASFFSGIVTGNNLNVTEMKLLSVASLSMNLLVAEYMLVVIRNK